MHKTVGGCTVSTPSNNQIRIERHFDLSPAQLFAAHTEPELIRQWLLGPPGWTMPVCEVDLRVGGGYRYEWAYPGKPNMGLGGTFTEIIPDKRIVQNEAFEEPWYPGGCEVAIDFNDTKPSMIMMLTYEDPAARDIALQSGMTSGMEDGYKRLDTLFQSA